MLRRCFLALALAGPAFAQSGADFRFVILGDRTGEAQPGVYEHIWTEIAARNPAFVLNVGDTIQGRSDATAESQWRAWQRILEPYRGIPLYLLPGNHDVWSPASEKLYRRFSGRGLHYSFDHGQAHFTILDNSTTDELSPAELNFLEEDLRRHAAQPLKFIVSHRPSWLLPVAFADTRLPLHQLAKRYRVNYVIAGHIHQMLRLELEGVTYLSMPSSGGHLRLSKSYEDGWFFHHTTVDVRGDRATFRVQEAGPPFGKGRATTLEDWGPAGLRVKSAARKGP